MGKLYKWVKQICMRYKEQLLYLIFGVLTTIVNYAVYFLSIQIFQFTFTTPPTIISWVAGVAFAYVTNKLFVFNAKTVSLKDLLREMISFIAARLLSLGVDALFMFITVDKLNWNEPIMKIVSNVFVVLINYVFSKFFVFTSRNRNKN